MQSAERMRRGEAYHARAADSRSSLRSAAFAADALPVRLLGALRDGVAVCIAPAATAHQPPQLVCHSVRKHVESDDYQNACGC